MLTIIGFGVLVVLGALFLLSSIFIGFLGNAFGGSAAEALIPFGIGSFLLYLAYVYAPFSITFTG